MLAVTGGIRGRKASALVAALTLFLSLVAIAVPFADSASAAHTTVDGDPNAFTNPKLSQHTVTITTSAASIEVHLEVEGGPNADIGANGATADRTCTTDATAPFTCAVSYADAGSTPGAGNETDNLRVWTDEGANNNQFDPGEPNETLNKTWYDAVITELDCEPETSLVTTGSPNNATCTVTDQFDNPVRDANVDAENETPAVNDGDDADNLVPDYTCTTPNTTTSNGQCTLPISGAEGDTGTATIRAHVDTNKDDGTTDEADQAETLGQDDGDTTDVITREWQDSAGVNINCVHDADNGTDIDAGEGDTAADPGGTNPTGVLHRVVCRAFDQFDNPINGTNIDGEIQSGPSDVDGTTAPPDFSGTTAGTGHVQFTYTGNNVGTDELCFWIDANNNNDVPGEGAGVGEGSCGEAVVDDNDDDGNVGTAPPTPDDDTDRLTKTWGAPGTTAQRLDCYNVGGPTAPHDETNEVASNNINAAHTWECRATTSAGADVNGVVIHVEATGVNDPDGANNFSTVDFTCTTGVGAGGSGRCQFTHNPAGAGAVGTTTYRAWIDTDGTLTTEADQAEGRNALTNPGSTGEPDNTDVVEKRWFDEATTLSITPTSDAAASGVCNPYTITLSDGTVPVAGADIDVRQRSDSFGTTGPHLDPGFCTPPAGSGPNIVAMTQYDDGAADSESFAESTGGVTDANGQLTFGIQNDTPVREGTVTLIAFCEDAGFCANGDDAAPGAAAGDLDAAEPQAQATKAWSPGGEDAVEDLEAAPATAVNPEGGTHTFTATLTNSSDQPVQGVTPKFRITAGPNAGRPGQPINCSMSDANGVSTCAYNDNVGGNTLPGTDTIEVWVDQSAAAGGGTANVRDPGEPFDTIQKTWTAPPSGIRLDLRCDSSPNGPFLGDVDTADENGLDCFNPLTQETETFQARAFNTQGTGTTIDDTPAENIQIRFDITGEIIGITGNARSIDFVPPNGATDNGPVFCNTGADGRCSVEVQNTDPDDLDEVDVQATVVGQTAPGAGNNTDTASKQWGVSRAFRLVLDPQGDTNQSGPGGSHTVVATVTDQFGLPIQGINVDFDLDDTSRNRDLTQVPGFVEGADRTTDAAGKASFTYNDSGTAVTSGTDVINAWADVVTQNDTDDDGSNPQVGTAVGEPDDDAVKLWLAQPGTTTTVRLDMDQDDVANTDAGTGDPNANGVAPDPTECPAAVNGDWDNLDTNTDSDVNAGQPATGDVDEICAAAFDQNGNRMVGGSFTFTIDGPAFFTNAAGTADLGQSITVSTDEAGFAHAFISSNSAGEFEVSVTKDGVQAQGTYPVGANPRRIDCEDPPAPNESPGSHVLICTLTDNTGAPVPGAFVDAGENGPGRLIGDPGNPCNPAIITGFETEACDVSNANGQVQFSLEADAGEQGTQTITAVISADLPGSGNPNVDDGNVDECDRPAGNPPGSPQGQCRDDVEKEWRVDVNECEDGIDNDGDGDIDFPADEGCESPEDDDESDEEPEVTFGPCQGFEEGSSNDSPALSGRIIVGTQGSDILSGTAGDDIICGLDGNDIIAGGGGEDLIVGNAGMDTIEGNGGKDTINGNRGADTIDGNRKNDVIRGSKGDDTIRGNRGHDTLRGGSANDTLQGGKGDDLLRGGGGNDTLKGFTGDDILNGGSGRDTCRPGSGNDRVRNCER